MTTHVILHFWFHQLSDRQRFAKDSALDAAMTMAERFGTTLKAAARGELFGWHSTALGRLAEIVVFDQFSRNICRDTPAAFSQDLQALTLAQELVASRPDQNIEVTQRAFAYLPYMHSESLCIHQQVAHLFSQRGMASTLAFENRHRAVLEQFGRYPHRNAILGRASSRRNWLSSASRVHRSEHSPARTGA